MNLFALLAALGFLSNNPFIYGERSIRSDIGQLSFFSHPIAWLLDLDLYHYCQTCSI